MSSTPTDAAISSRSQAYVLDACGLDLKALNMEKNPREVIAQVESGQVEEIHKWYGPTHGSLGSSAEWKTVKTVVNKRERIYAQLASEFNGIKSSRYSSLCYVVSSCALIWAFFVAFFILSLWKPMAFATSLQDCGFKMHLYRFAVDPYYGHMGSDFFTRGLPVSYLSPGGPEEACWLPDPRPRVARDQQLILGRKEGDFNTRFFHRFNSVRACGLGSVLYNGV